MFQKYDPVNLIDGIGPFSAGHAQYLYDLIFKIGFSYVKKEDKIVLLLFYNPSRIVSLVELIEKYNNYIYQALSNDLFEIAEYLRYRQLKYLNELKNILRESTRLIFSLILKKYLFEKSV